MASWSRREIIRAGAAAGIAFALRGGGTLLAQTPGPAERQKPFVPQDPTAEVIYPRGRVPLSFIIDDSTCLVNMGHYCMPQFAEAWPQSVIYRRPWKDWPREIPDSFVREFGEWSAENGVKGKWSVVPVPACVGWLDRELPGWSKKELRDSIKLVRELMVPHWDITPEMVTHTRVLDIKTGRPLEPINAGTMENSFPTVKKSADEIAAYVAYALNVLKNCEIPCEGITTPGGFGNLVKSELSLGVRQAVSDVFSPEIPYYFKYIVEGKEGAWPKLEHVEGIGTEHPKLVVNVPAGTGDWFGGWDGDRPPEGDKYANADASAGRMVELIERNEPAVMFCHWAGLYGNGGKAGFKAYQKIVTALNQKYRDRTVWMRVNEMARYAAARGLTKITRENGVVRFDAPFACPSFTVRIRNVPVEGKPLRMSFPGGAGSLVPVARPQDLRAGTWLKDGDDGVVCFDLRRGAMQQIDLQ